MGNKSLGYKVGYSCGIMLLLVGTLVVMALALKFVSWLFWL